MFDTSLAPGSSISLPKSEFDVLLSTLREQGYQNIGPRLKDDGIVYEPISTLADLPRGVRSEQGPARFRLVPGNSRDYFDAIPGAQSWKQYLFPPRIRLFTARKEGRWQVIPPDEPALRLALIGVRACELAAIEIQDRVFLRSDYQDPVYRQRREGLFIVAVNCLYPASTCFCASLGNGPQVRKGFDLCLTELDDLFLVEVGSELGRSALARCASQPASAFVQQAARDGLHRAASEMGRALQTGDLPGLLTGNLEAKHWEAVAKRCLSCANCTQVCPTCFCWDATDRTNLAATETVRERAWDSCFNPYYSYQAGGGNTRPSIRSRYRQWLSHKLGTWKEQFGAFGCVGCGRCITWCPAGIDLTEEIAALRKEVES
ncbi:MAG: sulfite reductase subunit A [Chloroflexi bacterium]|nr:sulfite reductase subunit A [Chloroflexota bacterium]